MTVTWTETATAQLEALRDYLARTPGYSLAVIRRVIERTEGLTGQPFAGAEVPEYADPAIREVFEHPYRIVYRVNGSDAEVVAVIHSSRRLPRTPPT